MASIGTDQKADEELTQLKALVVEQQLRLDALEAHREAAANGSGNDKEQRATRRQVLKLAGAAFAGAAGSAALRAIPASAADGDTMFVGAVETETLGNPTGVVTTSGGIGFAGASYGGGIGLFAYGYGGYGGGIGSYSVGGSYGTVSFSNGGGVLGFGSPGVVAYGNGGPGVDARTGATSSRAVYAYTAATSSVGVQAISTHGIGISAKSGTAMGIFSSGPLGGLWGFSENSGYSAVAAIGYGGGPDLKLAGSGRIVQVANLTGGVGAPNFTPATGYFEMVRAGDGAMWINRGTGTLQASWKRLNAVRADSADGTGNPFKPFRVIDTRSGAIKPVGSMTVVTVAGTGTGTSSIPSDAVAVIGNLTAVAYTGSGWLSIMPAGIPIGTGPTDYYPHRDPSSVNFMVGQLAIANSFVCGLNAAGQLQVYVAGHSSHFIIDITGYLQ